MDQPHRPYIKAYLVWHVLTFIMTIVVAIPIIGFGWLVCAIIGRKTRHPPPYDPVASFDIGIRARIFCFQKSGQERFSTTATGAR